MTSPFPYALPALELSAPLDRHRTKVKPEWTDGNGHMNVGYYMVAFDEATETFCQQFGVGWDYVTHRLGMIFVLEAHITYNREVFAGTDLNISTQVLDFDGKRLHAMHRMMHADEAYLVATNEVMIMHIDFATRRPSPWLPETLARIEAMHAAHRALPRPDEAGRTIGIKRSGQTTAA